MNIVQFSKCALGNYSTKGITSTFFFYFLVFGLVPLGPESYDIVPGALLAEHIALGAGFLEGMLAGWEAFKICFICVFAQKRFLKYSPQECVLQQHSCMSICGKLRHGEHGCSGSKSAEVLREVLVAGRKNTQCFEKQ